MNCKNCNATLTVTDKFCKNCGTPVKEINIEQNQMGYQSPINQNYDQPMQQVSDPLIQQTYGQSMQQAFDQPMQQTYEQPTQNTCDQPYQQQIYDQVTSQPINQNYNQSMQQTYNQPYHQTYDQSMQQTYGNPFQQPYGNSMNYNQPPKKNNSFKYIILGVVGVLVLAAIAVIIVMLINNNNSSEKNNNSSDAQSEEKKSTYKVNFKGFSFNVPDNYIYEEKNGMLLISDEEGTWLARIEIEQGNYEQIKLQKDQLQLLMKQSGYITSIAQVKTLGGVEFITMEVTSMGQNAVMAVAKGNSMYFMGITVTNLDNEFDYSSLETLAPIISSASYTGETSKMESETKTDINKIAEIAK